MSVPINLCCDTSFIEYYEGFRGFLQDILGYGEEDNNIKLTLKPTRAGTNMHYGYIDKNGKQVNLYTQSNNVMVDRQNLFGKMTMNHKPLKEFRNIFPAKKVKFN